MEHSIVIGIDSETCKGEPITIQLFSEDQSNINDCIFVDGENVSTKLFDYLSRKCRKSGYYRIYGHNLKFDLISFFWPVYKQLAHLDGFEFRIGDWNVSGFYGTPCFVRARKGNCVVEIVDSFLWFASSLANIADTYFPDTPKLSRPAGLGKKKFTKKDIGFVEYAMQDAIIAAKLGRIIEQMHADLEIKQQISLAGMSATVFRSHFLKNEIVQVPKEFIKPAINAYHGGKNNVITGAAPKWHNNVHSYDVSSAYPYSMTQLPGYSDETGYKDYLGTFKTREVPANGIYLVSGAVPNCEWPALFHHNFKPIKGEEIHEVWVTGYELNEALNHDEIKIKGMIKGLYYDYIGYEDLPLKRFSEYFYKAKEEANNPIDKFRNKIVLNSLTGKFIQTKETYIADENDNLVKGRIAAGMFQPMIAGAITGHTRSIMHYLEHELEAIHTATDGVFTYKKASKSLNLPKQGLGSLKYEGSGTLALVRNKLYVMYADDGKIASMNFKGQRIKKYARHAFQGTLKDLEDYLAFGKRKYFVDKPNSLKDSIKRNLVPNDFNKRPYMLRVGNMKI